MGYQARLVNDTKFPIYYQRLGIVEATFKGKLLMPVQSWFRLAYSFSPILVRIMMKELKCKRTDLVLDPFVGVGTTLIECKINGINSVGIDINPVFCEIARVATNWDLDISLLREIAIEYLSSLRKWREEVRHIRVEDFPRILNIELPKLYNIKRWWTDEALRDLLIARELINKMDIEDDYKRFLRVALMCILIKVANVADNMHPTLTFLDKPKQVDVIQTLETQLKKMILDLEHVKNISPVGDARVIEGDSVRIHEILPEDSIDCIITSPPYPNRISYVWLTRPHLYFFNYLRRPAEAGELDCRAIGGTWGKATSILQGIRMKLRNNLLDEVLGETVEAIRVKSNVLANYVVKYFNMMSEHIENLSKVLRTGARCAYVIGNSIIKGHNVPTDIVLAHIFEYVGFSVNKIVRFRKRIGKKGLYEAVVYATYE